MPDFAPDKDKTALLVIDMTNEFVEKGVPLEVPDGREMIPRLNRLIESCRDNGIPIIYTRHVLHENGSNAGLLKEFFPQVEKQEVHQPDSHGVKVYSEIAPEKEDHVITKHRYSAFHETELESLLKEMDIEKLIISGVLTNLCCETTARDAMMRDYKVIFLEDCTGTFSLENEYGKIPKEQIQKTVLSTIKLGIGSVKTAKETIKQIETSKPEK